MIVAKSDGFMIKGEFEIEIKISTEELRKKRLMLCTPMFGGMCAGMYTRSVADLSAVCAQYGIPLQIYYLFNESLIQRGRNYCCDEFMRSECTHMLFIDADIGFSSQDVIAMLAMVDDESPYDVLCAPYPKKCISWEKVKQAVDKGMADEDVNTLENFVGDYVFNPKSNQTSIPISEPVEVMEGGTGFMMIRRKTFDKYKEHYPMQSYRPDHVRTAEFDGSREIMAYFDCIIDPVSKRYLSEDYKFCYDVWNMGMKVWLCPWMQLKHVGTYIFGGSLAALASIGATATANPDQLGGKRKPVAALPAPVPSAAEVTMPAPAKRDIPHGNHPPDSKKKRHKNRRR